MSTGIWNSIKRELNLMCSRPVYMVMLIVLPISCMLFFLWIMAPGLPTRVPTAIVDMDHSEMSRSITQNLNSTELIDIEYALEDYHAALAKVRSGEIYGFFVIPANFEKNAIAGNSPSLSYYCNMTYFVPGSLSFKGYTVISVTTAGGIAQAKLIQIGLPEGQIDSLSQPVSIGTNGIGNPWLNYNYYLTPSFGFATLALLIMLFTSYSITHEIKYKTSIEWLRTAHNNMLVALIGKVLPQTIVYTLVAFASLALMFGFNHFPMNGSMGWMLVATALFVVASQAVAVFITCVLPNPRLAMSVLSLVGVLTFSFAGFSFPVEEMYGAIAIFSYLVPVRYWFLIYVNNALNGFDVYYVRMYYVALLIFPLVAMTLIYRLRRACLNPVYIP